MSIIADTLQRLQTQANGEGSDTPASQSIVIQSRGKREPGWHTRPSRLKFWLAGLGMAIGLSGLGVVAYWIGFHLDFGLSTYASPRTSQSMSLSGSSPILETSPFDSPLSESVQMPVAGPIQEGTSSASLQPGGELSTTQDAASTSTPFPPHTDNPLPTPPVVETPVYSETAAQSLSPTPHAPPQKTAPKNVSHTNNVIEISSKKEGAEPRTTSTGLPAAPPTQSGNPGSPLLESGAFDVTEQPMPIEIALEEERLSREESSSISHLAIEDPPLISHTTAMIPNKEKPLQTAQPPVSVQQSPTNWLNQAQQLIQAEKYEEAHAVLYPLFEDPPVNWEPWFWMGTALLGQSHLEQADQYFLSGLARNDKIPQLWIQRALVAHQRGEYQLAIHELRRAESLDAALPHVHLNMGYAYEKLGNERLANEYYAKFLKLSEGIPAFFSIRKKLYARFSEQIQSSPPPGLPSSLPKIP